MAPAVAASKATGLAATMLMPMPSTSAGMARMPPPAPVRPMTVPMERPSSRLFQIMAGRE
jgi:hypothetical protein